MNKILHNLFKLKPVLTLIIILASFGNTYAFSYDRTAGTQAKVIRCYPNPATSVINFEFASKTDKSSVLQIYSFSGKKMTDVPVSSSKLTIALDNDYYRGIYVFQVRDKNGKIMETGKFQVVK